ncbi:MAG: PaaI family thioesterase [Bacteroidaceae bacterium]|nr:PaaI family thioesterase [Bacteroidaceae bacterium]
MKKIKNPWLYLTDVGYHCFGCAPTNPWGLKLEVFEDGDDIVSFWKAHDNFQGWVKTLHGGIQATLIDEVAGWLIFRKMQTAGQTVRLNMKYKKPIPTGDDVTLTIRARLKETKRNLAIIESEILYNNEVCTQADVTYFCFSKEQSERDFYFSACELEG